MKAKNTAGLSQLQRRQSDAVFIIAAGQSPHLLSAVVTVHPFIPHWIVFAR